MPSGENMKKILYCLISTLSVATYGDDQAHTLHNYILANYEQFGGNMHQANELYKELLAADAPLFTYKGYIHLLFDTGNYTPILDSIPKLDAVFAKDQEIELIFAQVMDRAGKKNEADDRFIKLNDQFKTNQEIAFNAANSYLRRKEPENAIKVIDNLLNSSPRKPNNFIFYFMKAQIYLQLNDKQKALESIQLCLDLHKKFDKGWLLFALLNEQAGQLKDAIKGYASYLELVGGNNRDIESHLLQLVFKQKILEQNQSNMLVLNKKCFEQALMLFEKREYDSALVKIDQCIGEKPENDEAKLLKVQILGSMNQPQKAADLIKTWISKAPNQDIWYKTLHLLTKNNLKTEYALSVLKEIEKQNPESLLPVLYSADLMMRAHNNQGALPYHKKALKLAKEDLLKAKILYQIARINYEMRDTTALGQAVEQAVNLKAEFPPLSNLIAYYYSTFNQKIDLAQHHISQALKNDKHNPHFLDTQAFIYLKQKKYDEALNILQNIAQKVPCDYTILIHLAQVHNEKGQKQQALLTLRQAQLYASCEHDKKECKQLVEQWQTTKKF
jgi:predicted Zn-dependent protease